MKKRQTGLMETKTMYKPTRMMSFRPLYSLKHELTNPSSYLDCTSTSTPVKQFALLKSLH